MEVCRIYLAGAMSGVSVEEMTKWRRQFRDEIRFGDCNLKVQPVFFDPTQHYSLIEKEYKTEKEVMEYDLHHLRKSDIVVMNFNNASSIGTAMEAMLAKELRIPIIGINKDGAEVHPWVAECVTRMCDSLREAVDYVTEYYLT